MAISQLLRAVISSLFLASSLLSLCLDVKLVHPGIKIIQLIQPSNAFENTTVVKFRKDCVGERGGCNVWPVPIVCMSCTCVEYVIVDLQC